MRNVSHLNLGEWLEIPKMVDGVDQSIRLKLRWMPFMEAGEFQSEEVDALKSLEKVAALILDWNLESDGMKIPCNEENKRRYIEYLLMLPVEEEEKTVTLGQKIIAFACNSGNFSKNSQPISLGTKIGTSN